LRGLILGYRRSRLLYVAAKLGIADLLAAEPMSCETLAERAGAKPDPLLRVMRALVVLGVFGQLADGRFVLTAESQCLRSEHPSATRDAALLFGEEYFDAWRELLATVQTGEASFSTLFGASFYDHLGRYPESAARFDRISSAGSARLARSIVEAYDFSRVELVVDVAGGEGVLLAAILQANPRLRGVLFEVRAVAARARVVLTSTGVVDRCDVISGDFFKEVPAGGGIYLLKNIVHDWGDAEAVEILGACRRAMQPEGRVLVIQQLLPERVLPGGGLESLALTDVSMMVTKSGRERTEREYRDLLTRAGFNQVKVVQTRSELSLIEARVSPG
jgi:hypothetical protein